jgi:hypothetical protein
LKADNTGPVRFRTGRELYFEVHGNFPAGGANATSCVQFHVGEVVIALGESAL